MLKRRIVISFIYSINVVCDKLNYILTIRFLILFHLTVNKLLQDLIVLIVTFVAITVLHDWSWKFRGQTFLWQLDELCSAHAAHTVLWSGPEPHPITKHQALCGCGFHCCGAYITMLYNCLCCLYADNRLL